MMFMKRSSVEAELKSNYSGSVTLFCPTCAGQQFEFDTNISEIERKYVCASCEGAFSHDDLLARNSEVISGAVKEFKENIVKDFKTDLRKSFSNLKGWKIK